MSADTVVVWRPSTGWALFPNSLALSCGCGQLPAVLMCWVLLSSVFVFEYYLDTLWKGTLLFIFCLGLVSCGSLREVKALAPHPHTSLCMRATQEPPARTHLRYSLVPTGREAGDLVLSSLWHGCRPVARGLLIAPAPPSAEPFTWHVPLLHPWPNCTSGANASGLCAPGTQL